MKETAYTEIPNAEKTDIGKTCLMQLGCNPLAIEDTLEKCLETAAECGMTMRDDECECGERPITVDDVDDHTDMMYLANGDLVAVLITDVPPDIDE